jgi:hypothetical protein
MFKKKKACSKKQKKLVKEKSKQEQHKEDIDFSALTVRWS